MIDSHKHLLDFYKAEVRLDKVNRERLETARETCTSGVEGGLAAREQPAPLRFVPQGSFAMDTVVQHREQGFDIDHGVVFSKESLIGPRDGDKAPRAARQMVADAFDDDRFANPPEVRTNCVRFNYTAGYHVDMPVYRQLKDWFGNTYFEIASGDTWKKSDPEAVTKWFEKNVVDQMESGHERRRPTASHGVPSEVCREDPDFVQVAERLHHQLNCGSTIRS
jgi:hypothetical protein